jgi:hypothetical protein
VAVAPEGVRLAYQLRRGKAVEYGANFQQSLTFGMRAEGAPAGPTGAMSTNISGNLNLRQQIASVSGSGVALVRSKVIDGEVKMLNPAGGEQVLQFRDGKAVPSGEGEQGSGSAQAEALLKQLLGGTGEMRLGPTGRVVGGAAARGAGGADIGAQMMTPVAGGYGLLVLPTKPVRPGDTWTDTRTVSTPNPQNPKKPVSLRIVTTFTLKEVREREGRRIAVIESRARSKLPTGNGVMGMQMEGGTQQVTGTTEFDIEAGEVLAGSYATAVDVELAAPQAAQPGAPAGTPPPMPGGSPSGMKMSITASGTVQVSRRGS